ncbi:MAG: hypothetical protein AUK44_01800 [Porphyromonadaceae bacterium CG2_30_38_12]|nr:MAG: hypothetical protein AUK44_01800 [Porphyromonadaceae bacterium CG2_30_38_12]
MQLVDRQFFFDTVKNFPQRHFSQTEAWVDAQTKGDWQKLLFVLDDVDAPHIACVAHSKNKFGLRTLLIEGECFVGDVNSKLIKSFYEAFATLGYHLVVINNHRPYETAYEIGLRQAGFLRPVGLFSVQLSSYIDLQQDINFNSNWKRNIKKAQAFDLIFEPVDQVHPTDIHDFLTLYDEMRSMKQVEKPFDFNMLQRLLASNNFQLFFVQQAGFRIATILIHANKVHAGLLYAATSKKALENAASFFMYSELLSYLRSKEIQTFDMEMLAPSTTTTNSVFLFKNGIKGRYVTLNGEWLWTKQDSFKLLWYFIQKYIFKRTQI